MGTDTKGQTLAPSVLPDRVRDLAVHAMSDRI
jgi:hypothetical protein